jgi:hypothetical protein
MCDSWLTFQYLQLYFYCVTNAVKAIYAIWPLFDNLHGLYVPFIMCKLLPFGYFTILYIQIHFQNFHENQHETGGVLLLKAFLDIKKIYSSELQQFCFL